jgi:hypothetical protein
VHKHFIGKSEGKRPNERPRRTWEDNIKMDRPLKEMLGCGLDSTGTGWDLLKYVEYHFVLLCFKVVCNIANILLTHCEGTLVSRLTSQVGEPPAVLSRRLIQSIRNDFPAWRPSPPQDRPS